MRRETAWRHSRRMLRRRDVITEWTMAAVLFGLGVSALLFDG